MVEKNISQEVLEKIKGSKPKPKWEFLLKDYLIWFLGFISLALGALSFSTILYMFFHNDWDVYVHINNNIFTFIFLTLPYFWLIFLALFISVAQYNIRHTKEGYKFELHKIVIASIAISIILGSLLYNIGVGQAIDNVIATRVPFYHKFINQRRQIWLQTDKGLLAGVVVAQDGDNFIIKSIDGRDWLVLTENARMPFKPQDGEPVRCIGETLGDGIFGAKEILPMPNTPWMKAPPMFERKVKGIRIIR
ncbi:hypothetical protein C4566_03450 [Candidatus Parcubacteria bacterium]|nr:MAG: hypothetical protein C4566_03450 [Candidatus Parcubacteria bacterium]